MKPLHWVIGAAAVGAVAWMLLGSRSARADGGGGSEFLEPAGAPEPDGDAVLASAVLGAGGLAWSGAKAVGGGVATGAKAVSRGTVKVFKSVGSGAKKATGGVVKGAKWTGKTAFKGTKTAVKWSPPGVAVRAHVWAGKKAISGTRKVGKTLKGWLT
jgi:hypothetical protein